MYKLYPYQTKIVADALSAFEVGPTVLIESPTGSGKTIMGLSVASHFPELRVGWVATRRNLLAQARVTQALLAPKMNFVAISAFEKNPPPVDFLVVDEAHHDATDSIQNIHQRTGAKMVVGLTATPFRSDGMALSFRTRVRGCSIHTLIKDGYLSKYDHYTIPDWAPTRVAETYLRDSKRWGKSCMFFTTMAQCTEAVAVLEAGGARVELVTGKSDREAQLDLFERGKVDLLVNMMVLTEGFDAPSLQTVFVRDSTSRSVTIQMGGRVLRLDGRQTVKQVVQSNRTRTPFTKVARPRRQYILRGGAWVDVAPNPHLGKVVAERTQQVMRAVVAQLRAKQG